MRSTKPVTLKVISQCRGHCAVANMPTYIQIPSFKAPAVPLTFSVLSEKAASIS